jgi:predicted nucleic acid-binding protein
LLIRKVLGEGRIRAISVLKKNRKLYEKVRADFALGRGEAEAIALAFSEESRLLAIDDKNGINACKLLGMTFTTAIGILIRMREKGLLEAAETLLRLEALAKHGRYKATIIDDARVRLEGM